MREILFRGKRIDNGDWVYGNLILNKSDGNLVNIYIENTDINEFRQWEVILETVGQFTGLTDKNGVKIFEGDILESDYWACTCLVIWEDGGFTLQEGETSTLIGCQLIDDYGQELDDVQVIGNIHDNLELL